MIGLIELAERMDDFNARFASIVENHRLSTEGKNLAIGLLVTLRAPEFRTIAAALRSQANRQEAVRSGDKPQWPIS